MKPVDQCIFHNRLKGQFGYIAAQKRLKSDFSGLDDLIEQLSAYIQSTGKRYADHAATLRIWAKRQKTEQKSTPGIPDYTFKKGESL